MGVNETKKNIILKFLNKNLNLKRKRNGRRFLTTIAMEANGNEYFFSLTLKYYSQEEIFEKLCELTDIFFSLAERELIQESVYEFMKENDLIEEEDGD